MPPSASLGSNDATEVDELWQRLLALCPAEHHESLRLWRIGKHMREIAKRVGMQEESVRSALHEFSIRLACDTVAKLAPTRGTKDPMSTSSEVL